MPDRAAPPPEAGTTPETLEEIDGLEESVRGYVEGRPPFHAYGDNEAACRMSDSIEAMADEVFTFCEYLRSRLTPSAPESKPNLGDLYRAAADVALGKKTPEEAARDVRMELTSLSAPSAREGERVPTKLMREWRERHDLGGNLSSDTDLRAAFEDAATLHLTLASRRVSGPGTEDGR